MISDIGGRDLRIVFVDSVKVYSWNFDCQRSVKKPAIHPTIEASIPILEIEKPIWRAESILLAIFNI